ncbi:hypothetical protein SAMN02799622_04122 [Methylobacterium sp. UNC378MF]|uniref:hypothetical protein n=1 Tax=Methylobacterium sp. UNC378MF TaxID=1502748 RepID=UPI0008872C2A|nr:hypothetical protein [Methylobacterium sp. UNC378MF]SDA27804.1 hypothetical protein SAMN02799622_04122 [Methylobacterium sp. UNC378MF]
MPWAEQPSRDAPTESQVGSLVRASALGGHDPRAGPHEQQLAAVHRDREQISVAEKVDRAEADLPWQIPLSHRDRRPAHGDRR